MFEVGKVYTFNTRSPAFLGTVVKNAKCLIAGMDAQTARKFATIDQQYRKIYPSLPQGTVDNVNAATYYLFQAESGADLVLADQWIDLDSLNLIAFQTATIYLPNVTSALLERVRLALAAVNLPAGFSITVND